MARTKSINKGVKYTVVLPESSINELKELADNNKIASVNAGVREAIIPCSLSSLSYNIYFTLLPF